MNRRSLREDVLVPSSCLSDEDLQASFSVGDCDWSHELWLILKYPDCVGVLDEKGLARVDELVRQVGDRYLLSVEYWTDQCPRCIWALVQVGARGEEVFSDTSLFDVEVSDIEEPDGHSVCRPAVIAVDGDGGYLWEWMTGVKMSVVYGTVDWVVEVERIFPERLSPIRLRPLWGTVFRSRVKSMVDRLQLIMVAGIGELKEFLEHVQFRYEVRGMESVNGLELYLSLHWPEGYEKVRRVIDSAGGEYPSRG